MISYFIRFCFIGNTNAKDSAASFSPDQATPRASSTRLIT